MLIGIAGYLVPGDNYQLILPEVSSWTIDKRNKAQRKSNYQGGFTTRTTKYDESKFISLSWDIISEQDISLNNGYDNYTEPFALVNNAITVTATGTVVNVTNLATTISAGSYVYVKRADVYHTFIATGHENNQLTLKSSSNFNLLKNDMLLSYNAPLAGLLSLASISATGQSHVLRDFTGKLVKVVLNSPKYEALGGSDTQGQLYFNSRLDMDIIADTGSYVYSTVNAIKGSVYNEKLPSQGSVLSTPPTADPTTLYLQSENSLGFVSLQTASNYEHKLTSLIPYRLRHTSIGNYGNQLAQQLLMFKDYIMSDSKVPIQIKSGSTIIYTDPTPKVTFNLPSIEDFIILGSWSPTLHYSVGKFLEIKTSSYVVPKGTLITYKDTGKDYLSLIDKNSEPFTNTTAWVALENKHWYVSYNGKLYKLTNKNTTDSLGKEPGKDALWNQVTLPEGDITVQFDSTLLEETVNSSLFLVVAPMTLQTNTTPSTDFATTNLIRIPVLKEWFTFDVQLSASEYCIKTASTLFDEEGITCTMQDTTVTKPYPTNLEHNNFPALQINAGVIKANTTGTLSVSSDSYGFNIGLLNTDSSFILNTLWIVNNDPGFANLSHGTTLLNLYNNKGYVNYQEELTTKRKEFTSFSTVTTTAEVVVQTFTALDLTKSLYDLRYDHTSNKFEVIVYSLSLAPSYKEITNINGKFDPNTSGYKLIKTKTVYTSTTSTITSNTNQLYQAVYSAYPKRVSLSNAHTYITKPISNRLINNIFGLEGDTWV